MNKGYKNTFKENKLTLGIFSPIESYSGNIPKMLNQDNLIKKVENAGFSCIWVRDIPLNVKNFGDVGQMYDPLIYLSYLSRLTDRIALGSASIILPFRHKINFLKAIKSINNLSNGRLILGLATGDRPTEYDVFDIDFSSRGEIFRENFDFLKSELNNEPNNLESTLEVLPKLEYGNIPFLVTGYSQQNLAWISEKSDGWMYYPSNINIQEVRIKEWRGEINKFKPFIQSLYI